MVENRNPEIPREKKMQQDATVLPKGAVQDRIFVRFERVGDEVDRLLDLIR